MSETRRPEARPANWLTHLLAQAMAAAANRRREVWSDSFYADEAKAALAGASIPDMRLDDLLALALPGETEMLRYPKWQFEPVVLRQLGQILLQLEHLSEWNRHAFFTEEHTLLGMTPLNALRAGQRDQVLQAAIATNEDY